MDNYNFLNYKYCNMDFSKSVYRLNRIATLTTVGRFQIVITRVLDIVETANRRGDTKHKKTAVTDIGNVLEWCKCVDDCRLNPALDEIKAHWVNLNMLWWWDAVDIPNSKLKTLARETLHLLRQYHPHDHSQPTYYKRYWKDVPR